MYMAQEPAIAQVPTLTIVPDVSEGPVSRWLQEPSALFLQEIGGSCHLLAILEGKHKYVIM